jgi:hypothetical protein
MTLLRATSCLDSPAEVGVHHRRRKEEPTMSNNSKATQLTRDQQMIAGIKKHQSTVSSWVIAGTTYTAQQALDILQARVDAALKVPPAKAAYQSSVNAANTETANSKQFVAGLRKAIFIMFSAQVDTLNDYGIAPPKPRKPLSPVQKVQSAARNLATRAERHTIGKTKKAKIKGAVNVTVTVTPSPSVPAEATVAPATTAPHGSSPQGS